MAKQPHQSIWGNGFFSGLAAAGIPRRRRVVDAVAFGYPTDCTPTERLLAVMLALIADKDGGNIRPSAAEIAETVGIGERYVKRVLLSMRARGVIECVNVSSFSRNTYRFAPEWLAAQRKPAALEPAARAPTADGRKASKAPNVRGNADPTARTGA